MIDWGGGTFDVTICNVNQDSIGVEACKGDMLLGGRDLDEVIVSHFWNDFL